MLVFCKAPCTDAKTHSLTGSLVEEKWRRTFIKDLWALNITWDDAETLAGDQRSIGEKLS